MSEQVNHPQHYGGEDNLYEAIKVIDSWDLGFSLGNTVKYISRAGKKGKDKELEDLKKALWYLQHHIETLEKTGLDTEINVWDALTTPNELIRETLINFSWGFLGNSIVVFASKELDFLVLINYIVYYILISYIVNRNKYETMLGKFIILPGSAAAGAFTGYKLAQIISNVL